MNKLTTERIDLHSTVKCKLASAILMATLGSTAVNAELPTVGDVTYGEGDANYNVDAGLNNGTITASQHSVVKFYENNPTGNSLNIEVGETLNFESTGGAIQILLDDLGDQATQILGQLAGDGNVSVFVRNANGVIFGADSSVTNIPALLATTHNFDSAEFVGFSNGDNPLEMTASGGRIEVRGLTVSGGKLILVSDIVDFNGDVVSSGEIQVAIGETVEVNVPGSGLLTVDVTEALATASNNALNVSEISSIEAEKIDFSVATSDLMSTAVNIEGVVKSTGLALGPDGSINIVAKGGEMCLIGNLDAADGEGQINLTGDDIHISGEIVASKLDVQLGAEAAGVAAGAGVFDVTNMTYANASIDVTGAAGFDHTAIGFGNYVVNGLNSSIAGFGNSNDVLSWSPGSVQLNNIANLEATGLINNQLTIQQGASIKTLSGGSNNDTFVIAGMAENLNGQGGNDVFELDPLNDQDLLVSGLIDGGADADIIRGAFLRDDNGVRTEEWTGQTSSDNANQWTSIFIVEPAMAIEVPIDVGPEPETTSLALANNLLAANSNFASLGGLGGSSLNLSGESAMNSPCGVMGNAAQTTRNDAFITPEEPCYDTPEYLALLNTTIYFNNDSSKILSPAAAKLDRVSDFVLESDMFREIAVSGHTDSNAADGYNLALSKRRADAAVSYMANKGVEPRLFKTYSYGETLPAVPNDKAENLAKNRRVVVELKR